MLLQLKVPAELRRLGKEKRLIVAAHSRKTDPDAVLIKAVVRGHHWFEMLKSGTANSITDIANAEKLPRTYVGSVIPFALLAPDITEAILEGNPANRFGSQIGSSISPFPSTGPSNDRYSAGNSGRRSLASHEIAKLRRLWTDFAANSLMHSPRASVSPKLGPGSKTAQNDPDDLDSRAIYWRSRGCAPSMPLKCRGKSWPPENAPYGADWVAGGLGFEPRQAESESAVLPLDDPPPGWRPPGPPL